MVSGNPHVRAFSAGNLRWAFTESPTGAYQPLAYLTWMLDHALWGADPAGYHLGNALWHAAAAALAFLCARRLLGLRLPGAPARALDAGALAAALLFALHPLRVESVSWIAERRDPLSGALWLGALLAYLRAREPGRPRGPLWPAGLLFAAACLAKGTAVTFPLVLLVLDLWALRRPLREAALEKLPLLLLGGALGTLAVARQAGDAASWSLADHGLAARAAQAAYALVFYAAKTLWPAGLSPFYELRAPLDPLEPRFLASAAVLTAAAAAAWRLRRERPGALALLGAYAVMLLPLSGLLQAGSQLVADRYSYLACLPFALAGGWLLARHAERAAAPAFAAAALLGLTAATWLQQRHWRDDGALWTRVLALDPASPTGRLNAGVTAAREGRLDDAERDFRLAIDGDPACGPALESLRAGGPVPDALRTRPVCRRAAANLGAVAAQLGRREEARAWLKAALAAEPGDAGARRNLERLDSGR